jgi:hypothetical protein
MRNRVVVPISAVTLVAAVVLWTPGPVLGQQQAPTGALVNQGREETVEAARKASPRSGDDALKFFQEEVDAQMARAIERVWDPNKPRAASPRTAWGDPDLRGYWMSVSYTPMQRPRDVEKPFYTPQEAIEAFKKDVAEDAAVDPATVHYDWKEFGMDAWQSPVRPNLRTSLIIDPPDGRVPALTPEARARQEAAGGGGRGSSVPTRGLAERCVTGNQGPPRVGGHDNDSQILQMPGYVVLVTQSNHDVRIIPTDGRPHLDQKVRTWLGDSRGRWEGDTLVVETTNFHPDRDWRGATSNLTLVERLTRVDNDTLLYQFTVNDPTTWTKPWTFENPWPRGEGPIYEWACHEQNYGIINVVRGAQIRETEYLALPPDQRPAIRAGGGGGGE